jgi:hypothetical protein
MRNTLAKIQELETSLNKRLESENSPLQRRIIEYNILLLSWTKEKLPNTSDCMEHFDRFISIYETHLQTDALFRIETEKFILQFLGFTKEIAAQIKAAIILDSHE